MGFISLVLYIVCFYLTLFVVSLLSVPIAALLWITNPTKSYMAHRDMIVEKCIHSLFSRFEE